MKLTADAVVLAGTGTDTQVLLVKRAWPPFEGCWALPGGHVELGERCRDAALRELAEETGFTSNGADMMQVGVYDDPDRDPRGRVVSVAFLIRVPEIDPGVVGGDDAADAEWVKISDVSGLAFDHDVILRDALSVVV